MMSLTPGQISALKTLKRGKNVFLTGSAGTGKSFTINQYVKWAQEQGKNVLLTAPTGIAAINIGGSTIHRTFKVPTDPCPLESAAKPLTVSDPVCHADIIIIDEISMVRSDIFAYIAAVIKQEAVNTQNVNLIKNHLQKIGYIISETDDHQYIVKEPSGKNFDDMKAFVDRKNIHVPHPIQLVTVGDFYQLPPVVINHGSFFKEYPEGKKYFNHYYAFETQGWQELNFVTEILTDVVRQEDKAFSAALDKVKIGNINGLEWINRHAADKTKIKGTPIHLCSTNKDVQKINEQAIVNFEDTYTFYGKRDGKIKNSDLQTSDEITVANGARIMSVVNDPNDLYQNGSLGTITKINLNDYDAPSSIFVDFDNGNQNIEIKPYKWSITQPIYNPKTKKIEKKEIGSFTQLPVRLAYAITIHKSQGQTFDSMIFHSKNCFGNGMLYVALSRVKSIENLYIDEGKINRRELKNSDVVNNFFDNHFVDIIPDDYLDELNALNPFLAKEPFPYSNDHDVKTKQKNIITSSHKRGGARPGAGRHRSEPTKVIRIPKYGEELIKSIFQSERSKDEILNVLKEANHQLHL